MTWLEAEGPGVRCPEHAAVVTAVPWARHGARFALELEDQVAWLVARSAQSTVAALIAQAQLSLGGLCPALLGRA